MSGEYDNNLDVQPPGKFNKLSSINGIPNQTFLNCDIKGFNLHLGYNGQETEMTLDLVERMIAPGAAQKGSTKNLDNETYPNSQSCAYQPAAQPCQTLEYNGILGNVYTVRIYDVSGNETFNFSGILQDHDIKVDTNGRTISVRLTDARQYLDNVTLITNKHYGRTNIYDNTTGSSRNILNVLYEIEPNVSAAFDKVINYAGADKCLHYMDSGADKDGIPILFVLGQFMTSTRYLDLPLSAQRIRINIDDVFNAALGAGNPIPHRVSQSSISLLDLLQEACQHIGHDLYVYIEYTDSGYELVAKTLDKTAAMTNLAPVKTQLQNDYYSATPNSINIASVSYGQEAVVENTRNIVIGANHRYFIEIERDSQLATYRDNSWKMPDALEDDTQNLPPEELGNTIPNQNFPVSTQDYTDPPSAGSCYDPNQWINDFCTCATPNGGGRIAMLLGETMNGVNADGIPTYRLNLSNLCGDIIDTAYPIGELGAMLGYSIPGATAKLSQEELLFSETYESYINWSVMHPGSIGFIFGQLIFGALWGNFEKYALKIFADIVDNGSFDGFRDPALAFPDAEVSKKLFEVVHQYVKNIYDTYYGKEYVALLDSKIDGVNTFDVCLGKNYDTWRGGADYTDPSLSPSSVTIPDSPIANFINDGVVLQTIKSAGSNGYLNASDVIANGAWFAGSSTAHSKILGIDPNTGLSLFLNDDNTIGGFVKYGPYENICKRIGNRTFCFRVDFSSLDPSDFLVYQNNLYLRASFSEEMYFTRFVGGNFGGDKIFVRFSLPRVKLVPSAGVNAVGRAASRLALIALQVMTDPDKIDQITSGQTTLEQAVKDKLAGGGINPGVWDGVAANLAVTNLAKISIPAIVPLSVAIPFESQTMTYGPFAYSRHDEGGVNIVEHDLAPWHFGFGSTAVSDSFAKMITAGQLIARNNAMGRTYQEKATISRLGIPEFSIGSLFVTSDSQSAILTDINFSFGSDGAKTQTVYQTYSPKYGSTPQYLVESAKRTISYKLENTKKFRENASKNRAAMLKLREDLIKITAGRGGGLGGSSAGTENPITNSKYDHSPSKLLVGGYYNKNTQSEITNNSFNVGSDSTQPMTHDYQQDRCEDIGSPPFPLTEPGADNTQGNTLKRYASSEIHPTYAFDTNQKEYYKNMSIMSIDGIFLPVSVNGGPNNNLVRYANFSRPGDLPKSRPIHSMPPIKYNSENFFNLDINNTYLNPILNVSLMSSWDDRTNNSDKGFVIMNIGQGSSPEENFNFDDIKDADGSVANSRDNFGDFRFHALRGPLVLQSWGYDINGKPIPNANDSGADAEKGNFNDIYLKDKFLKNWLANPKTWPVGPIDLRWDRHRGVWVSPPANKIIIARLTSNLQAHGSASAELLNPTAGDKSYYDNYSLHGPKGENIKEDVRNCSITVYDYIGQALPKCSMVYVYYDDGKYIIVNAGINLMQRARIGTGQTLSCNGKCKGELFTISDTGAYQYGDANSIEIIDTMGLVPQVLSSLTRLWVVKLADSPAYEIVYIGNREGANCGSCGGFGVYSIAGVDFTKLPTVTTVGSVMTVTEGGCLALVSTADCAKTLTE